MKPPSFAVAADFTGVVKTEDGFGRFATESEALDYLIGRLECERDDVRHKLASARRRLRTVKMRDAAHG